MEEKKFDYQKEITYDILTMILERDIDFDMTYSINMIWIYIQNTRWSIRVNSSSIIISDMWNDGPEKKAGKEFKTIEELAEWLDKKQWGHKH